MKALLGIFKMRFKLILTYRMAAIAGLATQLFFGLVMVMIYFAFFESSGGQGFPMTLEQTVTYIWLGQALLFLLPWMGDREVQAMIRNGDFVYELVRPVDLYNFWLYRIQGQRLAGTALRSVPLILLAAFAIPDALRMRGPVSFLGLSLFVLTMITGLFLGAAISNIITISILFTIGDGIERLMPAIVMMFSGMTIPLAFFPDWSQLILRLLPFSGLVDGPYKFYLGIYTLENLPFLLGHQLVWTFIFIGIGRWMMAIARRRVIVQGG